MFLNFSKGRFSFRKFVIWIDILGEMEMKIMRLKKNIVRKNYRSYFFLIFVFFSWEN